ncbi:magnesium chelatase, partial [Flavihumibacter sediminis]|nr:magnesium chelatase [Flavihumibacter sediminis]
MSGPLLDRIDLQLEVTPVPFQNLSSTSRTESSREIRKRVIQARQVQARRYKEIKGIYCNAQMSSRLLEQTCALGTSSCQL